MARLAKLSERGRGGSQAVAKRRARSLKRETGGGKGAGQGTAARKGRRLAAR